VASFRGGVRVLLGKGDGTFTPALVTYAAGAGPDALVVEDFNGDGSPDLAVANYNGPNISVLLGNGDGTFAAAPILAAGRSPVAVIAADFDGDGTPDLAVANSGSNDIS
jgi:hypothetical protein